MPWHRFGDTDGVLPALAFSWHLQQLMAHFCNETEIFCYRKGGLVIQSTVLLCYLHLYFYADDIMVGSQCSSGEWNQS